MKRLLSAVIYIIFLLGSIFYPLGHTLADSIADFTNPPGCFWGVMNPEPDVATAIASAEDGLIVAGYVPKIDTDPLNPNEPLKGQYGIFFKLRYEGDHAVRDFYNSYVDPDECRCETDICVTCGFVSVTGVVKPDIFSGDIGYCSRFWDITSIPAVGPQENYVLTGTRFHRFYYQDPINPLITRHSDVGGVWVLKTDADGNTVLSMDYADEFPQQVAPDQAFDVYYSFGQTLTPVYDPNNGNYDFLIGANIYSDTTQSGWVIRIGNDGLIEWDERDWSPWLYAWVESDGVSSFRETSGGYLVSSDAGVWKLDSTHAIQWSNDDGEKPYRSLITEGDDSIVISRQDNGETKSPVLMKINAAGATQWTRTYGCTTGECDLKKVVRTDSGYVMVGYITEKGHGGQDIWLVGTDLDGNFLWDKAMGGEGDDVGSDLVFLPGITPALAVAGTVMVDTNSDGDREPHIWVTKTKDFYQAPIADFTYSPLPVIIEQDTRFDAAASDPDGQPVRYDWDFGDGTILLDATPSLSHAYEKPGTYDVTLKVWDNDGIETLVTKTIEVDFLTIQWQRVFDLSRYRQDGIDVYRQAGRDMLQMPDGGFAITGYSYLWNNQQGYTPILVKTDDRGIFIWQQNFEGFGYNPGEWIESAGEAIALDQNDDIVITGYLNAMFQDTDAPDLWLVKTDPDGHPKWHKVIDNGFFEQGNDIAVMDDGYLVAGSRNMIAYGDTRGWLAKFDFDGNYLPAESPTFASPKNFNAISRVDGNTGLLLTGGLPSGVDPVPLVYANNSGSILWDITWPETSSYLFHYLGTWTCQAEDGGYVVAGTLGDQLFIAKTDATPSVVWETILTEDEVLMTDKAWDIIRTGVKTEDNGYLAGATLDDPDQYRSGDFALVRFDAAGQEVWRWVQNEGLDDFIYEEPRAIISHGGGNYTVLVNRGKQFYTRSSQFVLIRIGPSQLPIAAFEADHTSGSLPLQIHFKDMSSNGAAPYLYEWDFGDTGSSTESSPLHTYTVTGQYTVSMTITDINGDSDVYTRNLYINAGMPALQGDIDADGDVDGYDLYLLQQAYGSSNGDANWNPNADINGDGVINGLDMLIVAENFG